MNSQTFKEYLLENTARFDEIVKRVGHKSPRDFRSCSATTYSDGCDVVLQSYSTIVAAYDYANNTLYVNGYYSQTTAQHVAKFIRDFCPDCMRVNLYINSRNEIMYSYPTDRHPLKVNSRGETYIKDFPKSLEKMF